MRMPLILILLLFTVSIAGAQTLSPNQPDFVGVELLGRGLLYSVNYERSLNSRLGLGAGVAHWRFGDGNATVVPVYVSATAGKTHSAYGAAGATFAISNMGMIFSDSTNYRGHAVGTATVGYQYRSSTGFVVRPTVSLIYASGGAILWPGVMIGHYF